MEGSHVCHGLDKINHTPRDQSSWTPPNPQQDRAVEAHVFEEEKKDKSAASVKKSLMSKSQLRLPPFHLPHPLDDIMP
jgi:hypothetical protein